VAQFSLVEMKPPILLAVPNVSEGRDVGVIVAVGRAFADGRGTRGAPGGGDRPGGTPSGAEAIDGDSSSGVRLLDVHSDADHHRSVFTLAGGPRELADALLRGAAAAVERIDVMDGRSRDREQNGQHPHVGAVDVVPVVYVDAGSRGAACAEALVVADRIGVELRVPVFLYGELTATRLRPAVTRAELRRGGVAGLAERIAKGRPPDFGPRRMHRSAGATLVAARPPLVAFNLQLARSAKIEDARRIAALIREGGAEGLPGLRAIGVQLGGGAQVSMNIERPLDVPLAAVIEAVRRHAGVTSAELVGLAPRAAFGGFPEDVPLPGFDPARHVIENALGFK
jgi:glutamate formiminotransferase